MITLDRVSKAYRTRTGRKTVLDNVTVTFEPGHNLGILGFNGVGKSTLIRLLAGTPRHEHLRVFLQHRHGALTEVVNDNAAASQRT